MKFFILIILLSPVASWFGHTVKYVYKTTKNCGGYNSTLSIKRCHDDDFCTSPIRQDINGTFIVKFGEVPKEPLFVTYSAAQYRSGRLIADRIAIHGITFLCSLIKCPVKPGIEYRLPLKIPILHSDRSKDVVRLRTVIDSINGDLEVCASRDIMKSK